MNRTLRNKIYNLFLKYQKLILGLAIFISLLSVSVTVTSQSIDLVWREKPLIALVVLSLGLLFFLIYIQLDQYQIRKLRESIQLEQKAEQALSQLTNRQREVYDLILSGKSNKEIATALFIEQSTLKTHINQLYKKLAVNNRRELKNRRAD